MDEEGGGGGGYPNDNPGSILIMLMIWICSFINHCFELVHQNSSSARL